MDVNNKYGVQYPSNYGYFISLKIGGVEYGSVDLVPGSKDPRVVQSLKIKRLANQVEIDSGLVDSFVLYSQAEFSLSTVIDEKLEMKLLKYYSETAPDSVVEFQYGYVNGMKSPVYKGKITSIKLSSDFYTLVLTVTHDKVNDEYNKFKQEVLDKICKTDYTKYSDLVNDIASGQGWKISNIVETTEIDKSSIEKPTIDDSPVSYIVNKLLKGAVSTKGEGRYVSVFKYGSLGEVEYCYVPTSNLKGKYNYKTIKNYNFIIRALPNGQVISFTPVLSDGTAISNNDQRADVQNLKNFYGVISRDTKEVVGIDYSLATENNDDALKHDNKTVGAISKNPVINVKFSDIESYAESILKDDISAYAYSTDMNASATMKILGDTTLQLLDYINVIPMYPVTSTMAGAMHPSGGTYQIRSIEDEIGNNFVTTLSLTKLGNYTMTDLKSSQPEEDQKEEEEETPKEYKVGDVVNFSGGTHYTSSYAGAKGYNARAGEAKITQINPKGVHQYHLVHTTPDSNVYGWVDTGTFS